MIQTIGEMIARSIAGAKKIAPAGRWRYLVSNDFENYS
jgi:hypothetical protein